MQVVLYEFVYWRLIVVVLSTVIFFWWTLSIEDRRIKTWYILLASYLCLYSGIGASIKEVDSLYIVFYLVYILILSITLRILFKRNTISKDTDEEFWLLQFIDRNGSCIIYTYLVLLLFDLVYPTFKLQLLINPPTPSLEGLHYSTFVEEKTTNTLSSIVYLARNFIQPFFYLSLYKYRSNIIMILLFLIAPVYIDLCVRGIVGRGQMLLPILIGFFALYEVLSPKKRKLLLIISLVVIPFVSYLLVQFSFMRIGASFEILSLGDCMQLLFGQEIAYPLHFSEYIDSDETYIMDYLLWLILLPFPGFMKFGYGDPKINLHFTQLVSGLDPTDRGFSICLPGLVGESVFVFGKYFFVVHAFILGYIISKLSLYLCRNNSFRYLSYYVMLIFTYYVSRGGTASSYSFAFKQFLILVIFVMYKNRKQRYIRK